jgi:phosphoglycerate kinase
MANTFLAAGGHDLADSLVERERVELAGEILERAAAADIEVLLPTDLVITDDLSAPGRIETVTVDRVPAGTMAVDIGPETRLSFAAALAKARTVVWNGPLGVFEKPPFDAGTTAVAASLADARERGAFTVIGGGETVAAAHRAGVIAAIGHVSTGGGASLELLAGKRLPGLAALESR